MHGKKLFMNHSYKSKEEKTKGESGEKAKLFYTKEGRIKLKITIVTSNLITFLGVVL